jgi:hypothetical protein
MDVKAAVKIAYNNQKVFVLLFYYLTFLPLPSQMTALGKHKVSTSF